MNRETLAYLAGIVDADGSITIRKLTYGVRHGTSKQPTYAERISAKQIQPQAMELLRECFGGHLSLQRSSTTKGRPLYAYDIHSARAGKAIKALLPFLRIKRPQAENALRLRGLIESSVRRRVVPPISDAEPLVSVIDFAKQAGVSTKTIHQAIGHQSVPSLLIEHRRWIPSSYLPLYKTSLLNGGHAGRPTEVTVKMEACYQEAKRLNHY